MTPDRFKNEMFYALGLATGYQRFPALLPYGGKATLQEAGVVDGATLVLALECGTQVVEVATQRRGMVVGSTDVEVYLILRYDDLPIFGEPDEINDWRRAEELDFPKAAQ